jgi:hypothetical protein
MVTRTSDDAVVLVRYCGRIRFVPGQASIVMIAPVFETGDPRYAWLNEIQAVGKGVLSADLTRMGPRAWPGPVRWRACGCRGR